MATNQVEQQKELVSRFHDQVWGAGQFESIDELVAEDYVEHNPAIPYEVQGREAYKQNVETFRSAFPDLTFNEEDVIAEGDKVVTRLTATGTHEGEFMGSDPTGNSFEVTGITIWRIEDGELVEAWVLADIQGMMQQLGLVPPPE